MKPSVRMLALILGVMSFSGSVLSASDKKVEDYALRLHIFSREEHTHYHRGVEEATRGDGRANLFADGEVHAVDFHFDCGEKIERSVGYETYMAKWKKPGQKLQVLFPVFGKAGKFFTCDLDTDVKPDVAYYSRGGSLQTEPWDKFKDWMVRHDYDPEHGKDAPANAGTGDATP
jgi:hypothetical protein